MKLFKKYDLYFVFGASIIFSVILMIFSDSREIGDNLFTEIAGVAMTVFVINKILERKERQKRVAIDQRILREVQSIIASYFSIWKHIAWKYLPEARIENEKDFMTSYPKMVETTNIQDQFGTVSIHHPESWKLFFHSRTIKECFQNYSTILTGEIQQFINDFKMFMDPELFDHLLNIMDSEYFRNIYMMNQEGTENILKELEQDIDKLDSYISPGDISHLNQFFELNNYCRRLNHKIRKFSNSSVELYQFNKYFQHPSRILNTISS